MRHSEYMFGNTSSGIIESASFGKYFINIGDRQKGRTQSNNIINVPINVNQILKACNGVEKLYKGNNVYFKNDSSNLILKRMQKLS